MALLPPFFLDTVVAIGRPGSEGTAWVATGFLYGWFDRVDETDPNVKHYFVYLVSNRHVFEGEQQVVLRFNPEADGDAKEYVANLADANGTPIWYRHPRTDVDVAVLPVNFGLLRSEAMAARYFQSDVHAMRVGAMREAQVCEGDGVFALGFPMALVGSKRNAVIVRRGSIARVRESLRGADPFFLADVFVFPGNSGGPVVTCPELTAIEGTKPLRQASLVGVVAAYIPYEDRALSAQTGRTRIVFEDNSGLAQVFTVDVIEDTIREHRKVVAPVMTTPPPAAAPRDGEQAVPRASAGN